MFRKPQHFILPALLLLFISAAATAQQKACFSKEAREQAERHAKVWAEPEPDYDPELGYNPNTGPRQGAPEVDENGLAKPLNCVANKKLN